MIMTSDLKLVFISILFTVVEMEQKAQACDGTLTDCGGSRVCIGGSTGITNEDFQNCVSKNNCDVRYRQDSCQICDIQPSQYPYGSQYKDCTGQCYNEETKDSMQQSCDQSCGSDGNECNPQISSTDLELVSDSQQTTLTLTGKDLITPGLQIVIYTQPNPKARKKRDEIDAVKENESVRRKRSSITLKDMAHIREISANGLTMKITIHRGLTKGEHRLGVRVGNSGLEYQNQAGVRIYVFAESDFRVTQFSPPEVNIGSPGSSINVTVDMSISDLTFMDYIGDVSMYCIISESDDTQSRDTDRVLNIDTDIDKDGSGRITFNMDTPETSTRLWVCPSVNGQTKLNCRYITFYMPAPAIQNNEATYLINENSVVISFNMAVESPREVSCTDIFTDISSFGDTPTCRLNPDRNRLTVVLGDRPIIKPGNTLNVKEGMQAGSGEFRRTMAATSIDVVRNGVTPEGGDQTGGSLEPTSTLEVTPRGYWPRELTGCAGSPITLGITIDLPVSGRPAKSIVWRVNQVIQDSNTTEIDVDVATPTDYVINVVVKDFLDVSSSITHTITKTALALPSVTFIPRRLMSLKNGQFAVYPRTVFGIDTKIQHGACLDGTRNTLTSFYFNWTRNDQPVTGHYFYKSTISENNITNCGSVIQYKLSVIRKSDIEDKVDTILHVEVKCRKPIAKIVGGSRMRYVAVTFPNDIPIDGRSSYDPDGGFVYYHWTCRSNERDCMKPLGLSESVNRPVLTLKPSNFIVGFMYTFTLTVIVEKSDGDYTSTTTVQIAAVRGDLPTVGILTLEHNFRRNVKILVKANLTLPKEGDNFTAEWGMVNDVDGYDWLNLSNVGVAKSNDLAKYTWYTIPPDTLTPGEMYRLQVRVTMNGVPEMATTQDHDIYIYRELRYCELRARDITELQETTLTLHSCVKDPASMWLETSCKMNNKKISTKDDLTFIVPLFKDRSVERVSFTCKVRDSLGYYMTVVSNEVAVTLLSDNQLNRVLEETIREERSKDNIVDTLELRASKIEKDGENAANSDQKEALNMLKEIRLGNPSVRDLKRTINSVTVMKPDKLPDKDKKIMAKEMSQILSSLKDEDGTEQAARMTTDEIKDVITTARTLVKSDKTLRHYYRDIIESTACIQMKAMKNDEKAEIELETGAKQTVAVLTLDDTTNILSDKINFPEDIKDRFRNLWQCGDEGESKACDDVAAMTEEYEFDSPDLQTGRLDTECAQYVNLDLYNPKTCKTIPVKNNDGLIEIKIPSSCSKPKCWYYEEVTGKFGDHGVTTRIDRDESAVCQTDHLTLFTLKTEAGVTTAWNIPLIIGAVLGTLLCVASLFTLVRSWCMTKLENMRREEEEDRRRDELVNFNRANSYMFYNRMYNNF